MTGIIAAMGGLSAYMKNRYRRLKREKRCVRCAARLVGENPCVNCPRCKAKEARQRKEREARGQ